MPRIWGILRIHEYFSIGGMFQGIIALVLALGSIIGYIVLAGLFLAFVPLFLQITIGILVFLGVLIGIAEIRAAHRSEDTSVNG